MDVAAVIQLQHPEYWNIYKYQSRFGELLTGELWWDWQWYATQECVCGDPIEITIVLYCFELTY